VQVLGLDHVNIAGPPDLIERCRTFYVDILGLTQGHRPPFRSRGFWLYAGGHPVVHLTERDAKPAIAGTNRLDHFALTCRGVAEAMERLSRNGIPFTVDEVPQTRRVQLFLQDPAGVSIELNFAIE
jgi:catechol 2,3-dioxygenase-like lactoylglutathione lyase family enzyme